MTMPLPYLSWAYLDILVCSRDHVHTLVYNEGVYYIGGGREYS